MRIVRIANNMNRNMYMYLNTRIFPTTDYARVLLFMLIRRELGGTGTGCLFQFTYCDKYTYSTDFLQTVLIYQSTLPVLLVLLSIIRRDICSPLHDVPWGTNKSLLNNMQNYKTSFVHIARFICR